MIIGTAASASLAFVLGVRHGLDADHLAAIDGLTRWNAERQRRLAPFCGLLFSVGHVVVILAMAAALSLTASHLNPPAWLATTGALISAAILLLLGVLNLRAAFAVNAGHSVRPIGLRSGWLASMLRTPRAGQVALVGALFAVSFDAVALAALFAASSSGVMEGAAAAGCFAGGMLVMGAANGFWVARLLRHAGESNQRASRVMTLTLALVALSVSACIVLPLVLGQLNRWMEAYEFLVSGFVVTLVLVGYFTSLALASRAPRGPKAEVAGTPDILN